jgi:hypothetical protein
MNNQQEHERGIILSFIIRVRQDRYLEMLAKPKRRKDITESLAHFKHLDMRHAVQIPPRQQHAADIFQLLRLKGAPETCYALSEDSELDGKEIPLSEALKEVVGRGMGTFLSCLAGRLAYFEDEDGRWILERRAEK